MTRLKLVLFRAAYNLPVTLGLRRGVFAAHGLDLDIVYTRGSSMTVEMLRAGQCDLGVLAADDVVYEVEARGTDLFVFMGLHAGMLTLVGRPEIRTLGDVAGKRLGVDDPASGFALVAHRILRRAGLARTAYQTVPAGGHEHRARALLDGTIDVALLTPPFTLAAFARGFTPLAPVCEHLPAYQGSCGVTTRDWARRHARLLTAYVRAHRQSRHWPLAPENRRLAIEHLAAEFALSPDDAEATYTVLVDPRDGLFPDLRIEAAGLQTVVDLRVEFGLLDGPRPLDRYLDTRYLEAATVETFGPAATDVVS